MILHVLGINLVYLQLIFWYWVGPWRSTFSPPTDANRQFTLLPFKQKSKDLSNFDGWYYQDQSFAIGNCMLSLHWTMLDIIVPKDPDAYWQFILLNFDKTWKDLESLDESYYQDQPFVVGQCISTLCWTMSDTMVSNDPISYWPCTVVNSDRPPKPSVIHSSPLTIF